MRKWSVQTEPSQFIGNLNSLASQIIGKEAYDKWAMPAIITFIVGATQKWTVRK